MSLAHETDASETDPRSWPSWVDAFTWECDDDEDTVDYIPADDGPDPSLEDIAFAAAEFAAQDLLERGLAPRDVTYTCDCEACVWARTAHFATD